MFAKRMSGVAAQVQPGVRNVSLLQELVPCLTTLQRPLPYVGVGAIVEFFSSRRGVSFKDPRECTCPTQNEILYIGTHVSVSSQTYVPFSRHSVCVQFPALI